MSLQLTPEEYERLQHHLKVADNRAVNNTRRCSPEKELKIVEKVKAGFSSEDIKREMRVTDQTIIMIRRRNGLWGV